MHLIKIAVPNKGRLFEPSVSLLEKAGIKIQDIGSRRLFANTSQKSIKIVFINASDIPRYVEGGVADLGITGFDIISEEGCNVKELLDLKFGKCRLVVAVPESSGITSLRQIPENAKVATKFENLAKKFFKKKKKRMELVELSGATEVAPRVGVADIIVDLTSTGTTLKINKLREIASVMSSSVRLIANRDSFKKKRDEINGITLAIKSVLAAEENKYVMANVPKDSVEIARKIMGGLKSPTIMLQENSNYVAMHSVVSEKKIPSVIKKLKEVGAEDILITSIERIVR